MIERHGDTGTLDRNIVALGARHRELVSRVSRAEASSDLSFITSRTGAIVPVLRRNGRAFPMHSRFDPVSEGKRVAAGAGEGYLIAFGLGGAFHLLALLGRSTTTGLMIVEKGIGLLRGILEHIDLTPLLSDSRVMILVDPMPEEITETVLDRYLPVLYGDFASVTLRTRRDADPEWFAARTDALRGLPESLGRDYTVQTKFGRRWFVHTVANLARSEKVHAVLPPARRLLITAAGPSLESQLPQIRKLKGDGGILLATDTSLPTLGSAGLPPDMVLSIDCQVVSYHHFLKGLPKETTLILDLASPPVLTRLTDRILFFSSGHPFSLYLNELYRSFPIIDLPGGSVTHAAMSVAEVAGAREVYLFGADFSYPGGRPYAQGAYVFPYFQSRSTRLASSESGFWKFIADSRPRLERCSGGWRWRTAVMDHYRESLEKAVNRMSFELISEPGEGMGVVQSQRKSSDRTDGLTSFVSAGPVNMGWKDFLTDYHRRLRDLPPLNGPPQDYLEDMDPENRQAWATLLPSAATFRTGSVGGPSAVEEARNWTMDRIRSCQIRHEDSRTRLP